MRQAASRQPDDGRKSLRILILNQSFHPDVVAVAQHASDLAEALVCEGHEITVVASRRAYAHPEIQFSAREIWRGCTVRRVACAGLGKAREWRRILDSLLLLAGFLLELLRLPAFDVVVAMTHPPMVSLLAALVTRAKGGRLVCWVMDLNPDQAIAAGWMSARSPLARLLNQALRFTLQRSRTIVLDRFMRQRLIDKGIPAIQIRVLPPWPHEQASHFDAAGRTAFRAAHGLRDKFVVMYSGNLSPVHPLDTILAAAEQLRAHVDIAFCFVGDGNGMPGVRQFATAHQLENIICLPYQPLSKLAASLSAADLHVVTMGDNMVGVVHPCKVYSVLALGIPLLHIGPKQNHITDILTGVKTAGAAYGVSHGDVAGAVAAIADATARRLGQAAELQVKAAPFSQAALISQVIRTVEQAAATEARQPAEMAPAQLPGEAARR